MVEIKRNCFKETKMGCCCVKSSNSENNVSYRENYRTTEETDTNTLAKRDCQIRQSCRKLYPKLQAGMKTLEFSHCQKLVLA